MGDMLVLSLERLPWICVLWGCTRSAWTGDVEFSALELLSDMRCYRAESTEEDFDLAFKDLVLASGSIGVAAEGAAVIVGSAVVASVGWAGQAFALYLLSSTSVASYDDHSAFLCFGIWSIVVRLGFRAGCGRRLGF